MATPQKEIVHLVAIPAAQLSQLQRENEHLRSEVTRYQGEVARLLHLERDSKAMWGKVADLEALRAEIATLRVEIRQQGERIDRQQSFIGRQCAQFVVAESLN